jgi:hypothetical protein
VGFGVEAVGEGDREAKVGWDFEMHQTSKFDDIMKLCLAKQRF